MAKKIRQMCEACQQVTTQVQEQAGDEWKCLCCESAKYRSQQENEEIKKRAAKKPRFNVEF